MQLPLEIIDEILSYVIQSDETLKTLEPAWSFQNYTTNRTATVIWDQFISSKLDPPPDGVSAKRKEGRGPNPWNQYPLLWRLYGLRLVSRGWNKSASRLLSRYGWWRLDFDEWSNIAKFFDLCAPSNVNQTSTQNLFNRLYVSTITQVLPLPNGLLSCIDRSWAYKLLPKVIDNLTNIQAFSISFPGYRATWSFNSDDVLGYVLDYDYDIDLFDVVMDTILTSLRSPAFQHLTDLRLTLPGAHDVRTLAMVIPQNVRHQLKHLYIELVDRTGPGCIEWFEGLNDRFQQGPPESAPPPSILQYRYPNRDHQDHMWSFIASCINLESLGVSCSHYFELHKLKWEPGPESRGLRALYLNRVYANVSVLRDLLSAGHSKRETSSARRVEFVNVRIWEDEELWSTVLEWMLWNCPDLEFLNIYNCGYTAQHKHHGESGRVRTGARDPDGIQSTSSEDIASAEDILREVIGKAGGLRLYPLDIKGFRDL
ncbi:hypothetical protein F4678DRAFT_478737 [Xylaria arbuscula]|nr:hypothetical protein F4678DRAFT_478737 [Xylaria arbuscula]